MNLVELETFAAVAAAGSFTAAARTMGVPKSTVSRRVTKLEDALGVPLLKRTGRAIALTETGRRLFERANGPLRELHDVERELRDGPGEPAGVLRVTAPPDIGALPWCTRMVVAFRERHPRVRVELDLTNRVVDLVAESFDVAIRPGGVSRSAALVTRRLIPAVGSPPDASRVGFHASPALLDRVGRPATPEELADFPLIAHPAIARGTAWTLEHDEHDPVTLPIRPVLVANDFRVIEQAVLAGAGISLLPRLNARSHVRSGALVELLPGWYIGGFSLHLVWPSSRHLAPRVRAFVDHAVAFTSELDAEELGRPAGTCA